MKRLVTGVLAAAMLLSPLETALTQGWSVSAEELPQVQSGEELEQGNENTPDNEPIGTGRSTQKATDAASPTPTAAPQASATPVPSPDTDEGGGEDKEISTTLSPKATATPGPTPNPEPKDWSGEKDQFLLALENLTTQDSGAGSLAMQFFFPQMTEDDIVQAGDKAVFSLPVDLMTFENSEEPVDIFAFVPKDTEDDKEAENEEAAVGEEPETSVTEGSEETPEAPETEEPEETALEIVIAQYEIADGVVHITFTDGIEQDEVRDQLNDVYGKLEFENHKIMSDYCSP